MAGRHSGGTDFFIVLQNGVGWGGGARGPSLRIDMALRHRGRRCEARCGPAVRKKPRFTHGRGYFRGDVSGKRFNTHVVE